MPTSDGKIGHRDLCTSAVVERTIGPASVSSLKIAASLQSDNFVAGSAGWKIERDTGSAEFNNVTVRGVLTVTDGTGIVEIDDGNWAANFASISLNRGFTNAGIIGVSGTNKQLELTAPWDTTVADRAIILISADTASLPGRLLVQAGNSGELALSSGTQTGFTGGNVDFFGHWEIESSDGDITGSLIPSADTTYHLGSTSQSWSDAFLARIFSGFGTVGAPSHTFDGDTVTGMFRRAANQLGFAAGGSLAAFVDSAGDWEFGSGGAGKARIADAAGSVLFATYGFISDPDTGMYRPSANQVGFTTAGAARLEINNTQIRATGSAHFVDANPGASGTIDAQWINSGGTVRTLSEVTSMLSKKQDVVPLDEFLNTAAVLELDLIAFHMKEDPDGPIHIGTTAASVGKHLPAMASKRSGKWDFGSYSRLVIPLIAEVRKLRDRVVVLEAA